MASASAPCKLCMHAACMASASAPCKLCMHAACMASASARHKLCTHAACMASASARHKLCTHATCMARSSTNALPLPLQAHTRSRQISMLSSIYLKPKQLPIPWARAPTWGGAAKEGVGTPAATATADEFWGLDAGSCKACPAALLVCCFTTSCTNHMHVVLP
eukprot:1160876-Pelagomonas_calceolata.AAC.2